jgi:hypothetical protein
VNEWASVGRFLKLFAADRGYVVNWKAEFRGRAELVFERLEVGIVSGFFSQSCPQWNSSCCKKWKSVFPDRTQIIPNSRKIVAKD